MLSEARCFLGVQKARKCLLNWYKYIQEKKSSQQSLQLATMHYLYVLWNKWLQFISRQKSLTTVIHRQSKKIGFLRWEKSTVFDLLEIQKLKSAKELRRWQLLRTVLTAWRTVFARMRYLELAILQFEAGCNEQKLENVMNSWRRVVLDKRRVDFALTLAAQHYRATKSKYGLKVWYLSAAQRRKQVSKRLRDHTIAQMNRYSLSGKSKEARFADLKLPALIWEMRKARGLRRWFEFLRRQQLRRLFIQQITNLPLCPDMSKFEAGRQQTTV